MPTELHTVDHLFRLRALMSMKLTEIKRFSERSINMLGLRGEQENAIPLKLESIARFLIGIIMI